MARHIDGVCGSSILALALKSQESQGRKTGLTHEISAVDQAACRTHASWQAHGFPSADDSA
jgi:hypothetical protein